MCNHFNHSTIRRQCHIDRILFHNMFFCNQESGGCGIGRFLLAVCTFVLVVACDILEKDISADRVRIIGPADQAEVKSGTVLFRWEALDGAAGYGLTIASASFTMGNIVADTIIYADTLGIQRLGCNIKLEAGKYEWSLKAFNSTYETQNEVRCLNVYYDVIQSESMSVEQSLQSLHSLSFQPDTL